jgi:hypothetical protein
MTRTAHFISAGIGEMKFKVLKKNHKKSQMKKLIQNNPRGLTAAIAVLACCTGAANATVEENKGSNFIAFSEQRGDGSRNLVISKLDLAMMDSTDREKMLASLEEQYGKPVAWASRAARSNFEPFVAYSRDGEVERQGLRLRARKIISEGPMELSQAACIPYPGELLRPSPLLGVTRSDVLTWTPHQDDYLKGGREDGKNTFTKGKYFNWTNFGFNYGLGYNLPGYFSPVWNGFSVKTKLSADIAGRFDYQQTWYSVNGFKGLNTRDVTGSASLGLRGRVEGIITWGHDWSLWGSYWGLGVEARFDLGLNGSAATDMKSKNTSNQENNLYVGIKPSVYAEMQGSVWIGNTTHKNEDDDSTTEGHKLKHGAKGQVVFLGTVSFNSGFECKEWDHFNNRHNNAMNRYWSAASASVDGKVLARAEIKFLSFTGQWGYMFWEGKHRSKEVVKYFSDSRDKGFDALL